MNILSLFATIFSTMGLHDLLNSTLPSLPSGRYASFLESRIEINGDMMEHLDGDAVNLLLFNILECDL